VSTFRYPCGCAITIKDGCPSWQKCPLHAAAQDLNSACHMALQWAEVFPLGIASSEIDRDTAANVARKCQAALRKAKDEEE
jgi:hypothetical protein